MRRLLALVAALALGWLWCNPLPAGATTNSVEAAQRGGGNAIMVAPQYYDFSNGTIPDCQYVADANLIEFHDPNAIISQDEVVAEYLANPVYVYWSNFTPLNFLESTGFDGITIASYQRIYSDDEVESGASAGGVYAWVNVNGPLYHAIAIIGANTTGPIIVWYGDVTQQTWEWYDANMVVEFAVTWATS